LLSLAWKIFTRGRKARTATERQHVHIRSAAAVWDPSPCTNTPAGRAGRHGRRDVKVGDAFERRAVERSIRQYEERSSETETKYVLGGNTEDNEVACGDLGNVGLEVDESDGSKPTDDTISLTVYEIANALPAASDRLRACRLGEVMQLPFAKLP
jgi:hypothetical protein